MTSSAQAAQPSPDRIFETLTAFEQTEALRSAIELDVFTAIGEGATTAAAVAHRCGASERGTRILCDYLTIIGFLTKEGGRYTLSPDSPVFPARPPPPSTPSRPQFIGPSPSN